MKNKIVIKSGVISHNNFCKVIEYVEKHINSSQTNKSTFFRDWIIIGIKLGLETGCRLRELCDLRFSDIKELGQGKYYIEIENRKVSKIRRLRPEQERFTYIPISKELIQLLNELDWEKYKGSDRYLLVPEITKDRVTKISHRLKHCFKKAYSSLNEEVELSFYCLRKTCIAALCNHHFFRTSSLMSSIGMLHCVDMKLMAAKLYGWSVFPEME